MALNAEDGPTDDYPVVSLVMPVWNEGRYLIDALDAIDRQTYPREKMEILIVDGGSTDDTLALARARMSRDPRITILGGPGVNTPAAMNIGIAAASGTLVAKVDGHGEINAEFIQTAVEHLGGDAVGCVGPRIIPLSGSDTEGAISLARFSRLGVGGGVYTAPASLHATATVQCGVYRRDVLDSVGAFDEQLVFGEDEELNYRIRLAGWTILMHPGMQFRYHVRPSVAALARQYYRYGRARVAVVRKHPRFFRPKHAVPSVALTALAGSLVAGLVHKPAWPITGLVWGGYAGLVAFGGMWTAVRSGFKRPDLVAASLVALHIGYGSGFLRGLMDLLRSRISEAHPGGRTSDDSDR
jgi:glycosyltransferase involved in cell wall biosynthesis